MTSWTNATIHLNNHEPIQNKIKQNSNLEKIDKKTFQLRGLSKEQAKTIVKQIIKESNQNKATLIITESNDTVDASSGYLYEYINGNLEKIDEKHGYEGAKGRDVEGYFKEEYDYHCFCSKR